MSIRCCADSNVIDPITNISWITDSEWYPDRSNCQDLTSRAAQNNTVGYGRVRIFSSQIGNNKWCYNLTTVKNQDYLIRGTFISEGTPSKSFFSFNVMIGTTLIGTVNSSFDTEVEGVFKATGDYINFCLEKDAKVEEGDPYISKLELRPLGNSDYLMQEEPSSVLKLIERVDVGSNELKIRYPMSLLVKKENKEIRQSSKKCCENKILTVTNTSEKSSAPNFTHEHCQLVHYRRCVPTLILPPFLEHSRHCNLCHSTRIAMSNTATEVFLHFRLLALPNRKNFHMTTYQKLPSS